jgi:transcriptional regulator with XRE-family HTH domain
LTIDIKYAKKTFVFKWSPSKLLMLVSIGKCMEIGKRLKDLRRQREFTLEHLAPRAGCSKSFLSKVENDSASPSLATLVKIIQSLGSTLHSFFNGIEKNIPKVIKADERQKFETQDGRSSYELLARDISAKNMEPFWVIMEAGASSGKAPIFHKGERWGIVLEGKVEVKVGDEVYLLGPGDAIYFDTAVPHRWRNPAKTRAIAITVISPPNF